jgi:hypothetical protein
MKKLITIPLLLLCLNIFAQETRPCLFIGHYKSAKADCSDRVLVREAISSKAEYDQRRQKFYEEHSGYAPYSDFVSEKDCVIICEFKTRSVFNCSPAGFKAFIALTMEGCRKKMEQDIALYQKNRTVNPVAVYERNAFDGK